MFHEVADVGVVGALGVLQHVVGVKVPEAGERLREEIDAYFSGEGVQFVATIKSFCKSEPDTYGLTNVDRAALMICYPEFFADWS